MIEYKNTSLAWHEYTRRKAWRKKSEHNSGDKMKIELIDQYRGLPKQIYILLIARIVIAIGSFVYPFLTFFLSTRMNFTEERIGKYLMIIAVISVPAVLLGGKLADKYNRKYVYVGAMFLSDVFFIACGFTCDNIIVVKLILAAYFFVNMAMPALSAMMMDVTKPENRQESFSLVYLGYNLGFALGPLIAGLLFENYTSWIFWGQGLLNFMAMILVACIIKDTRMEMVEGLQDERPHTANEPKNGGSLIYQLFRNPIIIVIAIFASVYAFSYAQLSYVMPLHMEDVFGMSLGSKYYGIMWSLNGIVVFVATPLMVLVFKRFSPVLNLCFGGILYALGFGLYAYSDNLFIIYLLVIIWSSGEVLQASNTGVFIANHAPESHRGRFQSLYDIIQGTGRAIGPMLMGYYLVGRTTKDAWHLIFLLCMIAVVAFYLIYIFWEKPDKKRKSKGSMMLPDANMRIKNE